jgi:Spy/CpxP family protein refolding chaperone
MKASIFRLLLVAGAFAPIFLQPALGDDATTTRAATSSSESTNPGTSGDQSQRRERLKQVLAQLDLTNAQKDQIKQIRASVTDHKERRQQILAILTPDQRTKLRQLIMQHGNEAQSGTATSLSPDDN